MIKLPESNVKIQVTDEDHLQYLEKTYGKLGKVFFDWRQGLTKNEANEPYVNMRELDQLVKLYQDGHLAKEQKVINFMLNVNEDDLNTLITNVKQFEQANSIVDKMQKLREFHVESPNDGNKNKPTN